MFQKIKNFISKLAKNKDNPRILSVLIGSISTIAALIFNTFYTPIFVSAILWVLFVSLAVISILGQIKALEIKQKYKDDSEKLKKIVENMEEGIIVYSEDFQILEMNKSAEEILNLKSKTVKNKKINPNLVNDKNLKLITQIIFPSLSPIADRIKTEGWPHIIEISTQDPEKNLMTITSKIKQKQGNKFIKIIKDKTRQKEIEESKNEFVTTTAHQLRTPLNGINWAFENLEKDIEDEDKKEIIKEGLQLSNRALKVINDLLAVTEIEGENQTKQKDEIDINEPIKEIIKQSKPLAREYEIDINFNSSEEAKVLINKSRIKAVISTLLENAITYNEKGGKVDIKTRVKNSKVQIEVSDTGMGIPEEEMDKLFDKFHRGQEAKRVQPNGSGLGLYMAKKIINREGGKIRVKSQKGRGTSVYFTLPLVKNK